MKMVLILLFLSSCSSYVIRPKTPCELGIDKMDRVIASLEKENTPAEIRDAKKSMKEVNVICGRN